MGAAPTRRDWLCSPRLIMASSRPTTVSATRRRFRPGARCEARPRRRERSRCRCAGRSYARQHEGSGRSGGPPEALPDKRSGLNRGCCRIAGKSATGCGGDTACAGRDVCATGMMNGSELDSGNTNWIPTPKIRTPINITGATSNSPSPCVRVRNLKADLQGRRACGAGCVGRSDEESLDRCVWTIVLKTLDHIRKPSEIDAHIRLKSHLLGRRRLIAQTLQQRTARCGGLGHPIARGFRGGASGKPDKA